MWVLLLMGCLAFPLIDSQQQYGGINSIESNYYYDYEELKCPQYWYKFQQSCYRFMKSPLRPYPEARRICQVRIVKNVYMLIH